MINFKDYVYIDQKLGNDNNTGKSSMYPIKSITRAKELVCENGVMYIIGTYSTEKIEFIFDKLIHIFGVSVDSNLIYFSSFGDFVPIIKNVNFYKLNIKVGDNRYDYEPAMYGNYYNCIINMNGSMYDNYSNFYNCLFLESSTGCGYRSNESAYWVHGEYKDCIFNTKYFNDSGSFRNIFKDNGTNLFLDNLNNTQDIGIGIYFGKYSYYFNRYNIYLNNMYYTINNDKLICSNITDKKESIKTLLDISENIIGYINTNYNIIKIKDGDII